MKNKASSKRELIRIGKHLNEIIWVKDQAGNLLHKIVKPIMVELYPRDIVQMIVGATLLAIPVAFTEEVWKLGQELPWKNILLLTLLSLTFVGLFVYYNFYRNHFENHKIEFFKRVFATYFVALSVAFVILILLNKAPLGSEFVITLKRMIILSFPASMSAAITDMIK